MTTDTPDDGRDGESNHEYADWTRYAFVVRLIHGRTAAADIATDGGVPDDPGSGDADAGDDTVDDSVEVKSLDDRDAYTEQALYNDVDGVWEPEMYPFKPVSVHTEDGCLAWLPRLASEGWLTSTAYVGPESLRRDDFADEDAPEHLGTYKRPDDDGDREDSETGSDDSDDPEWNGGWV